jgi:hypothetical protein
LTITQIRSNAHACLNPTPVFEDDPAKKFSYWSGKDGPNPYSEFSEGISMLVGLLLIICVHVQIMISMALPPQLQENAAKVIMHAHTTTSSRREYPFMAIF